MTLLCVFAPFGYAQGPDLSASVAEHTVAVVRQAHQPNAAEVHRSNRTAIYLMCIMKKAETDSIVEKHPWGLFVPENARVLMLGSFPPLRKRWCMDFYYPNINNDMWRIMGQIYYGNKDEFIVPGEKRFDKEKIVAFLREEGIALGDVATAVVRENGDSSDLHLKVVETIDLEQVLASAPHLDTIVVTGEKACIALCESLGAGKLKAGQSAEVQVAGRKVVLWRLVSSSRAYPLAFDKKVEIYRRVYRKIR